MSKYSHIASAVLFFTPFFAHAVGFVGLTSVIDYLTSIFSALVPMLIGIAVLVFLWGIVKFIAHADDERAKEEGKQFMIWGMIALFVMVSLWAIVGFIQESLIPASGGNLGALPMMPDNIPAS